MFVFTVTTENEGGLLSPSYRWNYVVSPEKLMSEPGKKPMTQFWMGISPLGESRGCRAEPCLFLAQEVKAVLTVPSYGLSGMLLWASPKTCAHPVIHLYCVRSGRIPQPLQVLMFAYLYLSILRLGNNFKLVSRDIADATLFGIKSKMQEASGSMILIFCMQNFSSIFSAFPTGAT